MEDDEEEAAQRLHIVVFPWLAFGHILPFLELSKSLARRGHRVSFLSSPGNLRRLPAVPPCLSSLIRFVPLALPRVDGLPLDAEATIDLPLHQVPLLKLAFDGLAAPFSEFISSIGRGVDSPDWILIDFAHHWAPAMASENRIPCAYFSVFHAANMAFGGPPDEIDGDRRSRVSVADLMVAPKWVPFPTTVACSPYRARQRLRFAEANISGISDGHRVASVLRGCSMVALRSCLELEERWLRLLAEIYGKPTLPVGWLMQRNYEDDDGSDLGAELSQWLNSQAPRSLVYIAFGSEAALSVELLHQLALGIEKSGVPFLWALRRPAGTPEGVEILPEGFEERTSGRGMVEMSWVPQLKVLAHASVGGFLTHCGWSSVMEALRFGHPLVMLPIAPDQALIARSVAEMGVGVEVERDEEDGSFGKEMVAMALRSVLVDGDEGNVYRVKAEEVRVVVEDDACHERYIDDLVRYMSDRRDKEK